MKLRRLRTSVLVSSIMVFSHTPWEGVYDSESRSPGSEAVNPPVGGLGGCARRAVKVAIDTLPEGA